MGVLPSGTYVDNRFVVMDRVLLLILLSVLCIIDDLIRVGGLVNDFYIRFILLTGVNCNLVDGHLLFSAHVKIKAAYHLCSLAVLAVDSHRAIVSDHARVRVRLLPLAALLKLYLLDGAVDDLLYELMGVLFFILVIVSLPLVR